MIASLNLFIVDGISGSVSRVAIIYIGILHCLFLLSTMAKVGETRKRKCKFSENVRMKFPFFSEGRNENEAKCNICDCFVNFGHRGSGDLQIHVDTEKHKSGIRKASSTKKINTFFSAKVTSVDKNVKAAEATLAFHSVLHHHSYNSVDCRSELGKVIYSDSQIANNVKCGRTKTEAIVNHVLAPHALDVVTSTLRNNVPYFGIGTNASNHGALKLFPVVA